MCFFHFFLTQNDDQQASQAIDDDDDDAPSAEDFQICHFPEHKEFVIACRKAEAEAKRTGATTYFWYRGYRGVVAADLPTITLPGMEVRLMNALQKIPDKTVAEIMVNAIVIKKLYININL